MNADKLKNLKIQPKEKHPPHRPYWMNSPIAVGVMLAAVLVARPWVKEKHRVMTGGAQSLTNADSAADSTATSTNPPAPANPDLILTVSGYIINRERIELSPRFLGLVKWIGVKKGDAVTNGQVVVLLDDAEYKARLHETEGRFANTMVAVEKAELYYQRASELVRQNVEMR